MKYLLGCAFDDRGLDSGLIIGAGSLGKVLFEILENKK